MRHIAKQIHAHFRRAQHIVVIPHQNPDGDALGAATALIEHLREQGKRVVLFCATPIPKERWAFLAHVETATSDPADLMHPGVDTVVVLDAGDLRYAGVADFMVNHPATIINIDHHATNEWFGHHNLVIPTAASTTEILYHFLMAGDVELTPRIATSLLTGIITDTDSFTNAATSAEALKIAGELIRAGAKVNAVTESTLKNKTVATLRLWGTVFSRLEKNEPLKLAYTYITRHDLDEFGLSDTESEGIANFLNNLDDTDIALILKETADGKIKGSFRTTKNDVDVTTLAKPLGGGGHKKAAGFTTTGTIQEVLKKILQTAQEHKSVIASETK